MSFPSDERLTLAKSAFKLYGGTPYLPSIYIIYNGFSLYAVVTSLYTVTYSFYSVPSVVLIQFYAVAFSLSVVHVVL